jgi:predicted enzyme related to lactoylglutathione lyase
MYNKVLSQSTGKIVGLSLFDYAWSFLVLYKLINMNAIEIIMIPVKDQQVAKAFYLKLGWQVIVEAPGAHNDTWIQMGFPGRETTISLAKFQAIICETDNIEKDIAALKEKGIKVGNVDNTPWGKFAWLKDPDDNSLCLRQK